MAYGGDVRGTWCGWVSTDDGVVVWEREMWGWGWVSSLPMVVVSWCHGAGRREGETWG